MRIHDKRFFESLHSFLENYLPKIKRRDSDTIKAYKEALNQYLNFICSSYKISLMEVTIDHFTGENIVSFIDSLSEKGYAISTINHRLSLLRSFCKYAMRNNLLKIIELEKITEIKEVSNTQAKSLVYLSIDEMAAVLRLPDVNTKFGSRDRFYMALLYDSAARVQEICDITVKDLRLRKPYAVLITGKGDKTATVPLMKETADVLKKYLSDTKLNLPGKCDSPLFSNHRGEKLLISQNVLLINLLDGTIFALFGLMVVGNAIFQQSERYG